jgi:spore coat polysaccharide biosynthesis protein SpsF
VIDRAKKSRLADHVILCTTNLPGDDRLCDIARKNGILYFRGSVEDKLERWRGACDKFNIDFFITADGDDLFCDPQLMDLAFAQFENNPGQNDFIKSDNVICGAFTYAIKSSALRRVCEMKKTTDTEMMWVYFTDTGLFNVKELENIDSKFIRDDIRMTLDYKEDLEFFTKIIENFENTSYTLYDVVEFIDKNPGTKEINFHRQQDWSQNQKDKTKLVVK